MIVKDEINFSVGILKFDPKNNRIKNKGINWLIVECDDEIIHYYKKLIYQKQPFLNYKKLEFPPWGSHISVVRGGEEKADGYIKKGEIVNPQLWKQAKKEHDGEFIRFTWDSNVQINEKNGYVWIIVKSKQLEDIRTKLGLSKQPYVPFHITIGKSVPIAGTRDILNNQAIAGKLVR